MGDDLPQLSAAELDVMRVLWAAERLSAAELHEQLEDHGWARSTLRTVLTRLVGKGAVRKEAFHGVQLYAAEVSRPQGLAARVRDFARQVLEAPAASVVPLFAQSGSLTEEELAELEALLGDSDDGGDA